MLQAEQEEAHAYLATMSSVLRGRLPRPFRSLALSGAAASKLLELTTCHPGSVIVMSTHGGGALARATLGSVTSETLHYTSTPVVVIPPHAPPPLISIAPRQRSAVAVAAQD